MRQKNLRVNRTNIGAVQLDKKGKSVVVNGAQQRDGSIGPVGGTAIRNQEEPRINVMNGDLPVDADSDVVTGH